MVYLQGMSQQFQINVVNVFYNKCWNQFGKLLNALGFLLLSSEKNRCNTFLICYFLVIDIYCFFDDHDAGLLLLEYFFMICLSACGFWKVV